MYRFSEELKALERRLAQQAAQVSVLEELGLTYRDYLFLEREVAQLFRFSPSHALDLFRRYVRYSAASFLTLVGVYRYAQNTGSSEYWRHVADALGVAPLSQVTQGDLGRLVEDVVSWGGMAVFPKAEGARRYVDLVLLHGGIPNGCLQNYFDHVLRHIHPSASGQEVIATALEPTRQRSLLKPVSRYLQYGGDVAADFVERTVDLLRHGHRLAEEQDSCVEVLKAVAAEVGLPVRVVKAYREWLAATPEAERQEQVRTAGRQWRSPALRFDPLQLAPFVDLPAQDVGEDVLNATWTLRSGAEAAVIKVPTWRRSRGRRTDPHAHTIAAPQVHYEVRWSSLEGERRWTLPGLSRRWPLLVFYGRDGQQVDITEGLPKDVLWILHPRDYVFMCDSAILVEAQIELSGQWSGYVVERWDLRPCPAGAAPRVGDAELWLRPEGDLRPYIDGRTLPGVMTDDVPVFGSWPRLIIPYARQGEIIGRWLLRWSSPSGEGEATLDGLATDNGSGWTIDLRSVGLPPYDPVTLRLRGPLGRSARFNVSVWEGVRIEGAGRLVLPLEGTPAPASLDVCLPDAMQLLSIDGATITLDGSVTRIEVLPQSESVELHVRDGVRVRSLDIAIPRLRAHLYDAGGEGPSSALATTDPLHIQGDWLDQATIPRVTFMTGAAGTAVDGLDADFGSGDPVPMPQTAGRTNTFDLAELAQAAANRHRARARLWARVGRSRALIGEWHARLGLRGLQASAVENAEGYTVRMSWDAGRLVGGVQARLWSVWAPWEPPLQAGVKPDGPSAGVAHVGHVPPGRYLVELVVEDPWTPARIKRPAAAAPEVATLDVGSLRARYERLSIGVGVQAEVTRYLAAHDDAAGRTGAWRRACGAAVPADIPLLLSVAGLEAGEGLWERLARAQQDRLFEFLEPAVVGVRPAVLAALATEDVQTLAAYAIVLGYLDASPEDWGGPWEPLAACGLGAEALCDPYLLVHLADRLGLQLPQEENGADDEVRLSNLVAAREGFGERPNDAFGDVPIEQVRAIRDALGLVPDGPLSKNALQTGYAEWLIAREKVPWVSDRLGRDAADLKRDLRDLKALNPERFASIVQHALAREHPLASGGQAPTWLNAPFAVGATAVLLRAQALCPAARALFLGRRVRIRTSALRALQAAPDLFGHDLCWTHLELVNPDRPAA